MDTNELEEKDTWVVLVEADGNQMPPMYYRRLRSLAYKVRGDKEQGPLERRDEGQGVIFQEGAFLCPSYSLARSVAFLARDMFNKIPDLEGYPTVQVFRMQQVASLTRTPQDAQILNRIETVLSKKGRKPKATDWVVSCTECCEANHVHDWTALNCPNCGGLLIHSRKGKPASYRDPGGDVFDAWRRLRFANGLHWEPVKLSEDEEAPLPPEVKDLSPGLSQEQKTVEKIRNSGKFLQTLRSMERETAFAFLDTALVNRTYRDSNSRNEKRVQTAVAFFARMDDPTAISLVEPADEVDLIDAADALGVDTVVGWLVATNGQARTDEEE
jgi:ribosomal protein S27E